MMMPLWVERALLPSRVYRTCTAISGRSHHRTDTSCLADGSCTTARTTDIQRIAIRHDSTIIDEGVHIGIGSELPRYPLPHFNSHFIVAAGTDGALIRPAVFRGLQMTTKMVSQLKLNDAQKTKVAALNKEYQDYLMPEPPQGEGPDKNGEKPDMKKPGNKKPGTDNHQGKRQEYEKKLKKILTDDQYKSYQKMGPRGNGKAPKNKQRD